MTSQRPVVILPQLAPTWTEVEVIADVLTHPSIDIPVQDLWEKNVQIMAVEQIVLGVPGNLLCWIEVSPVPSTTSMLYWTAIGGGGGDLNPATGQPWVAPIAPITLVAIPLNGAVHTLQIDWQLHSGWARLVVSTPVAAALPGAFWAVQAYFEGKTT